MKMYRADTAKSGTAKGRLPGCLQPWQRWLLGFYVLLFGWVLPFICWGAMAEPGHPHRLPHLVFAMPLLADSAAQPSDDHGSTAMAEHRVPAEKGAHHGAHHPTPASDDLPVAAKPQPTDTPVPGRSTPKLIIFSLLLLLLLGAWLHNPFAVRQVVRALPPHFPTSIMLAVPLRPPRWAACYSTEI